MIFLIDENLPASVGKIFTAQGFEVEYVRSIKELRGQPDEAIFEYAIEKRAVIITRDLGFGNPLRFDHSRLKGLIILRFPNEISITELIEQTASLTRDFFEKDFEALIVIEPGSVRRREL